MKKENKLYIAYGSNLNLGQMKHRCPYATVVGTAILPNHKLTFRGCETNAVASIEPCNGESVPVLMWEITPRDEESLDKYEGFPKLYRKETVEVISGGKSYFGMVYIMNDGYDYGKPSRYYLRTIREGYETAGFDVKYLYDKVR